MAEGELLPKGKTSKEWLAYADKKLDEFKAYMESETFLGRPRTLLRSRTNTQNYCPRTS